MAEILRVAQDFFQGNNLFLELTGMLESGQVLVSVGNGFAPEHDRACLFYGKRKMAVLFQQLFGSVPPALEFTLAKEGRHQQSGELVLSTLVAVVGQDGRGEGDRVGVRLGANGRGVQRDP